MELTVGFRWLARGVDRARRFAPFACGADRVGGDTASFSTTDGVTFSEQVAEVTPSPAPWLEALASLGPATNRLMYRSPVLVSSSDGAHSPPPP